LFVVKFFLSQTYLSGNLAHWLAKIHEHDLTIMNLKTIKGQDLSLHLAQHDEASEEIDDQDNPLSTLFYIESQTLSIVEHPWYKNMVYYLQYHKCPDDLYPHQRRRLSLESSRYIILGYFLFRRSTDGILLRCVNNEEEKKLLQEANGSSYFVMQVGGHLSAKDIAFKIIRNGYYWPLIFGDSYKFARSCDKCQKLAGKEHISAMPLQHVLPDFAFSKWVLDFIGPINPPSFIGKIIILTANDYFTKWTEVVPLRHSHDEQVISFLETNIFSIFGIPLDIIIDNDPALFFAKLTQFLAKLGVKHFTSSTYYPQGNGKVESTNKNLVRIIKRLIEDKPHQWHTLLTYTIW
jgi:hypothetical protein